MPKGNRHPRRPARAKKSGSQPRPDADFWCRRSAEELAEEQGVPPITRLEDLPGQGKGLWKRDAEFERFLSDIYEQRRRSRGT